MGGRYPGGGRGVEGRARGPSPIDALGWTTGDDPLRIGSHPNRRRAPSEHLMKLLKSLLVAASAASLMALSLGACGDDAKSCDEAEDCAEITCTDGSVIQACIMNVCATECD